MTGEKLSAEFCKSPNSDTVSENIQLGNLTKVSHGVIHMHESYGNESFALCTVTFNGSGDGVIIFNHKRSLFDKPNYCIVIPVTARIILPCRTKKMSNKSDEIFQR